MNTTGQTNVSIPESITINGVTYSVRENPELQAFIQEVAKVEKSKLYSQFESLKSQINNLTTAQVETPNAPFDVNQLKQEISQNLIKELMPQLKTTVTEIVQPVLAATQKSAQDELAKYREQLINKNAATCIPELVVGNSKEELDKALQNSIKIRSSYPSANVLPQSGKTVDPLLVQQAQSGIAGSTVSTEQTPPTPPKVTLPTVPNVPAAQMTTGQDVKKMSMEEFTRNRDSLKANLENILQG